MMKKTISGIHYKTGEQIELEVSDGHIKSMKSIAKDNEMNHIIAPGFIDLQINGYNGIDFNEKPLTQEEWHIVISKLLNVGVTTFYPTIITNSFDQLSMIFEQNAKILMGGNLKSEVIGGFHLEGPYLSPEDGPRGAHAKKFIREPNWDEFCLLQEKAQGLIKIVTLSPEWDKAPEFIKRAVDEGITIAIGHTAANSEQIKRAVDSGARLSTHLGNGAHLLLQRHPNYIWDQLSEDDLWASVISDGHHLPNNVLRVIKKVKRNKMIIVSDSVALAGMEPDNYSTAVGGDVTLTPQGRLHLKDQPSLLAGSAQNILQNVQYFATNQIGTLQNAINSASIYPAKLMRLEQEKGLQEGAVADIILLDKSEENWMIKETYKKGVLIN